MKAVIDLGTNTFHLLIASVHQNEINVLEKLQIPVKIGEKGINKNQIAPDAFRRGMDALSVFRKKLNEHNMGVTKAYGTSAIRDAENGKEFIEQALRDFDIEIEAISGTDEALFIFNGVKHSFELPESNVLVMDIGGGSVEFIIGNRNEILWKYSYPIGAARLIERFHKTDPISDEELVNLQSYLVHNTFELHEALKKFPVNTLVGSAGAFETLIEVLEKDLNQTLKSASSHAKYISKDTFYQFYTLILESNEAQRSALKGLIPYRVEMIVVSAVLIDVVLKQFDINQIIASSYSLKEGVLFS